MARTGGLVGASLLGLLLGLAQSLPRVAAADCDFLGQAERLTFAPAARTRWLTPRVRPPGPLDPLYGTVRRFLSAVQLNPFPSGELCPPLRPGRSQLVRELLGSALLPPPPPPVSPRMSPPCQQALRGKDSPFIPRPPQPTSSFTKAPCGTEQHLERTPEPSM